MPKQTAVEWLYERLERMIPRSALYNIDKMQYFQQANKLFEQQIIDAKDCWFEDERDGEQYYDETYKTP